MKNGYNHTSFDLNGNNGALRINLAKLNEKYNNSFDIITNHGTSEHVDDQYTLFKNLHNWGKGGCVYVHCVPLEGEEHKSYLNYEFPPHGEYEYSSKFWDELCLANNYEMIISTGNMVSNQAINYPKNFYSASCYKKKTDDPFISKDTFMNIFDRYCKDCRYKVTPQGHLMWKNSLPNEVRQEYRIEVYK